MKIIAKMFLLLAFTVVAVQSAEFKMYPVTSEDKAFLEQIKNVVLADDAQAFSRMISYPVAIRPNDKTIKLEGPADIKKNSAAIFTARLKSAVRSQTPDSLFKNWRGVMIGKGEIWFSKVLEKDSQGENWEYRIIGINPEESSVHNTGNEEPGIEPGPPVKSPSDAQENVPHYVVAKGDTAIAICRKFQISTEQLLESNPGLDVKRLSVGQRVRIPMKEDAAAPGKGKLAPPNDASSQESKSGVKDSAGQKPETPTSPPKP